MKKTMHYNRSTIKVEEIERIREGQIERTLYTDGDEYFTTESDEGSTDSLLKIDATTKEEAKNKLKEDLKDMQIEWIVEDLIAYTGNSATIGDKYKEVKHLFRDFSKEWDAIPCDPEGATKEQDKEMDELLLKYAKEIYEAQK